MSEFHAGTRVIKSRSNAFDIPPKSKAAPNTLRKICGPKPSKTEQSCIALDTPEERAARRAKRVTDFHPMSMGAYPALSAAEKSAAWAKTAILKGKP